MWAEESAQVGTNVMSTDANQRLCEVKVDDAVGRGIVDKESQSSSEVSAMLLLHYMHLAFLSTS